MILAVNNINNNNFTNLSFKAHPDFNRLKQSYNVTASSYFRRGLRYGTPDEKFADVVRVFSDVFTGKIKQAKNMLIAGIADSQEPFSYLAVIKGLLGKKSLRKAVDMHTIDLQSKPDRIKLFEDSFLDDPFEPLFAKDSFVKDEVWRYGFEDRTYRSYRVKDEIYNYLNKTYNNPKKSMWDVRLQDAIKELPDENFDVVSINNTFMYIENSEELQSTLDNVLRTLKKGGYFITDPYKYKFFTESKIFDNMDDVYMGIYRKK